MVACYGADKAEVYVDPDLMLPNNRFDAAAHAQYMKWKTLAGEFGGRVMNLNKRYTPERKQAEGLAGWRDDYNVSVAASNRNRRKLWA